MGDRVYSNEVEKYYSLPGLNAYAMNLDVDIAGAAGNAPDTVGVTGLFSFNSSTSGTVIEFPCSDLIGGSALRINESGMYSLKLIVCGTTPTSPATVDLDFNVKMVLTRSNNPLNGLVIANSQDRYSAPGASAGSNGRILSLDITSYLRRDDQISISITNYSSGVLRLLKSTCQLLVSKIY